MRGTCSRCTLGIDNDGDGNCSICARISDTFISPFIIKQAEMQKTIDKLAQRVCDLTNLHNIDGRIIEGHIATITKLTLQLSEVPRVAEMQLEIDRLVTSWKAEEKIWKEDVEPKLRAEIERLRGELKTVDSKWIAQIDRLDAELSTLRGALEAKAAEWTADWKGEHEVGMNYAFHRCADELSALAQSVPTKPLGQVIAGEGKNDEV